MTTKEKRLLLVAAAIFVGYLIPFQLGPVAMDYVHREWEHYQSLKADIPRYQRLHEQTQVWRDKHEEAVAQQQQIERGALEGSTRELAAARLQRILKAHAKEAGIQVKSLNVPEFAVSGDWLLVTQSIHFSSNSSSTLKFLQALTEEPILLPVVDLDLRTFRVNQLNGMVKVTGFTPVKPAEQPAE